MIETTMKETLTLEKIFCIKPESGWANGGLYTPDEIVANIRKYGLEASVTPIVRKIAAMAGYDRMHEILHCFDVGFGAAALTRQIAEDGDAMQKLGLGEVTGEHVQAALVTGLLHDAMLSMSNRALRENITEADIVALVAQSEVPKFAGITPYAKDAIGDDLRGAVLLESYGQAIASNVRARARGDLLAGSDLEVKTGAVKLISTVSPYKVLDAIWYHDGNFPVRGVAEAGLLLGDKLELYKQGLLSVEHVVGGVDTLLKYTEEDPKWEQRDSNVDVPYLEKRIAKKAGPFMDIIRGTKTYDFVVEELAAQQRGSRTVNSGAFAQGVARNHDILFEQEEQTRVLSTTCPDKLDILRERYDRAAATMNIPSREWRLSGPGD